MEMQKKPKAGAPQWMTSFCDLMQLLLTFFIMLFATSSTDAAKLEELVSHFASGDSILSSNKNAIVELDKKALGKTDFENIELDKNEQDFAESKEKFESIAKEYNSKESQVVEFELMENLKELGYSDEKLKELIEVSYNEKGVLVTFKDGALFEPGSTIIRKEDEKLLRAIGQTFEKNTSINIEGHTDNVPDKTYPSNWELSTARSISIMKFLTKNKFIKEEKCSVTGFGEFKPVASNDSKEGRSANRRVEILIQN